MPRSGSVRCIEWLEPDEQANRWQARLLAECIEINARSDAAEKGDYLGIESNGGEWDGLIRGEFQNQLEGWS